MHGQRVNLAFENAHPGFIDDGSDVRNDGVTEDVVDQAVISLVSSRGDVLH